MSEAALFLDEINERGAEAVLSVLERAETVAANLGQRELAGQLYALRYYIGGHVAPATQIATIIECADRYREAVDACFADPLNRRCWQKAHIRYASLIRMIGTLKRVRTA